VAVAHVTLDKIRADGKTKGILSVIADSDSLPEKPTIIGQ